VRAQTRRQLKQDRFAETAKETYSWAVEHRGKLIVGGTILGIALAVGLGSWFYMQYREQQASMELGRAMRTYDAPIRAPGTPAAPDVSSFASARERAKAAEEQFRSVADKYRRTKAGQIARYFVGITAISAGDLGDAEGQLKEVSNSRDQDLASLAKFALASLYRNSRRPEQAIQIYKELSEHTTRSVSKNAAQLELASLYEPGQPQEAKRIYEQIQKENPRGAAGEFASGRLQNLK